MTRQNKRIAIVSALLGWAIISAFSSGTNGISFPFPDTTLPNRMYKEVKIGGQVWMAENLNVSRFRNGDSIQEARTTEEWIRAGIDKKPVWCYFENDTANGTAFGRLYNWYAVNDARGLAPAGWRIPNNKNWMELSDYLGGDKEAGKKMKSALGWNENGNGTNESGFNALPGGGRYADGLFVYRGESTGFWSTTTDSLHTAWFRYLAGADNLNKYTLRKAGGMYVRCIKK